MFQQPDPERARRLAEIRRQIRAGSYETPERLERAVEALLDSGDLERAEQRLAQPPQ